MSPLTLPPPALDLRERMAEILTVLASGLRSGDDIAVVSQALTIVLTAPTLAAAIGAYTSCVLALPGLDDGTGR